MVNYEKLADALFGVIDQGEYLYAILDAARSREIAPALQNVEVEKVSLYRGRSEEPLWDVAPCLIRCERQSHFFQWMLERGWGNSWGVFFISKSSTEELLAHFQQFLLVELEDDKKAYFRFYDPGVLRAFLPTCTIKEMREFFGTVRCYLCEAEDPETLLKFLLDKGAAQEPVGLSGMSRQVD